MPIAKTAGKALGKQALRSGMGFAGDVLGGASVKESAIKHAKSGGAKLLHKGQRKLQGPKKRPKRGQKGGGIGKARRGKKSINTTVKAGKAKGKRKPRQKKEDSLGTYML
ncbi:MAG: hypothetical protein GY737_08125 [Desulfobacteraceae bacterium]|nr:hypothetical protein [Desulfobacteraceae bacterium]